MKLPIFICVGAQKSGTTSLHDILKQHKDIVLPISKETKFFLYDRYYKKGIEYYKNEFFPDIKNKLIMGEIDPEYMYFDHVAKNIYELLGNDIKIIFMLRNPVDRAYSHFLMNRRRGYEKESFNKAILLESNRIKKDFFHKNHFSYIDRGLYAKQIKNYLKYFKQENMFFILFEEDFLNNREDTINKLLNFLGLSNKHDINKNISSNKASFARIKLLQKLLYNQSNLYKKILKIIFPTRKLRSSIFDFFDKLNKKPIDRENKEILSDEMKENILKKYFLNDIEELEKIINRSCEEWYK